MYSVLLFHDPNYGACAKTEEFATRANAWSYISGRMQYGEYESAEMYHLGELILQYSTKGI